MMMAGSATARGEACGLGQHVLGFGQQLHQIALPLAGQGHGLPAPARGLAPAQTLALPAGPDGGPDAEGGILILPQGQTSVDGQRPVVPQGRRIGDLDQRIPAGDGAVLLGVGVEHRRRAGGVGVQGGDVDRHQANSSPFSSCRCSVVCHSEQSDSEWAARSAGTARTRHQIGQ